MVASFGAAGLAVAVAPAAPAGPIRWLLAGLAVAGIGVGLATGPRVQRAVVLLLVTAAVAGWVGANSPSRPWLGSITSHGPRSGRDVALTFDDGPNVHQTLALDEILVRRRVTATFFTVGKALDARPDITRTLRRDGQIVGDHSYHHDQLRWLDPRYRELDLTEAAFRRQLRVCPTFFRPPHGRHTPLMALAVTRHHMRMIGWDVSGHDWATDDAAAVVRRVLAGARPGSIIDLHDGLDGKVGANQQVLVRALPAILDGLAQRGLHPVGLDRLLAVPAYRGC